MTTCCGFELSALLGSATGAGEIFPQSRLKTISDHPSAVAGMSDDDGGTVRVAVRVRPFNERCVEIFLSDSVVATRTNLLAQYERCRLFSFMS